MQPQSAEGASKEGAKGTAVLTRVRTAAAVALRSESAALEPEPELRPPKNTRVKYVTLAPRDCEAYRIFDDKRGVHGSEHDIAGGAIAPLHRRIHVVGIALNLRSDIHKPDDGGVGYVDGDRIPVEDKVLHEHIHR